LTRQKPGDLDPEGRLRAALINIIIYWCTDKGVYIVYIVHLY